MRFRSARFKNFRLLRDLQIDFSTSPEKPLTVIRAENETGKTTILTALQWILFGDDALPPPMGTYRLHPIDWDRSHSTHVEIEAELEFEHTYNHPGGATTDYFIAKRTARAELTDETTWTRTPSDLQLLKKTDNGWIPLTGGTGTLQLRSFLGSNLRELFFTDGDRALSFITADMSQGDKRKLVQRATRDMLGFDVLEASRKHVEKAGAAIRQQVGSSAPTGLEDAANRMKELDEKLERDKSDKESAELEAENLGVQAVAIEHKIEAVLEKGNKEELLKQSRNTKTGIEAARLEVDKQRAVHADLFRSRSLGLALCRKGIVNTKKLLDDLKAKGKLPRTTVPILKERLEIGTCICGTQLTPGSKPHQHLLETIAEQEKASWIDDRLTTLRVKANEALEGAGGTNDWFADRDNVLKRRQEIENRLGDLERLHKELDARIAEIPDSDITSLRKQKTDCLFAKDAAVKRAYLAEANIGRWQRDRQTAETQYNELVKQSKQATRITNRLLATQDILNVLKGTYEAIETAELPAVSEAMNKYFLSMIGADEQAAIIQKAFVTKDFDIVVSGPSQRLLDPDKDLNGASRRALTLAFILALTEVSGVSAPNVIDTPLGMMSPQIKRAVVETAVEHCEQLILFLTRSEINDVEALLDKYAGVVITLSNSAHYPKWLLNDPGTSPFRTLKCTCTHRQWCTVCGRVGDMDSASLKQRAQ